MKITLIKKTDGASFYIYLYHVLVILLVNIFIDFCGITAQGLAFIIRCACVFSVTIAGCILYTDLIKKIKVKRASKKITEDEHQST